MKRITQKLMFALALSVASIPAFAQMATPTNFTPAMVGDGAPFRFFANFDSAMMLSSGVKDGKFNIYNAQLNLGLIYSVGMGFDVGVGIHGGMYSPIGMFRDMPALLDYVGQKQYGMMFGADFMARYLAMFGDMFYGGAQAQIGYNYTDIMPGATDAMYTDKTKQNSFIPVVAGLVFGVDFKDAACVYLFPAIEMGQTGNYTNDSSHPVAAADINKGMWKSAVGMQVAIGTAINLGATKLVLEVKPRMANFNNSNSWGMNATLGAFWDF